VIAGEKKIENKFRSAFKLCTFNCDLEFGRDKEIQELKDILHEELDGKKSASLCTLVDHQVIF
jgi:hypothetical protein